MGCKNGNFQFWKLTRKSIRKIKYIYICNYMEITKIWSPKYFINFLAKINKKYRSKKLASLIKTWIFGYFKNYLLLRTTLKTGPYFTNFLTQNFLTRNCLPRFFNTTFSLLTRIFNTKNSKIQCEKNMLKNRKMVC